MLAGLATSEQEDCSRMAEKHDFILVGVGEGQQYLAWAHIVSVVIMPVVAGTEIGSSDRLVARIATVDGQTTEVYDDEARALGAQLQVRAGLHPLR